MSTQEALAEIIEIQGAEAMKSTKLACEKLHAAQKLNDGMQKKHALGTPDWHMHESIDDRIHEALSALGD